MRCATAAAFLSLTLPTVRPSMAWAVGLASVAFAQTVHRLCSCILSSITTDRVQQHAHQIDGHVKPSHCIRVRVLCRGAARGLRRHLCAQIGVATAGRASAATSSRLRVWPWRSVLPAAGSWRRRAEQGLPRGRWAGSCGWCRTKSIGKLAAAAKRMKTVTSLG